MTFTLQETFTLHQVFLYRGALPAAFLDNVSACWLCHPTEVVGSTFERCATHFVSKWT
jgi:hypothetical protein